MDGTKEKQTVGERREIRKLAVNELLSKAVYGGSGWSRGLRKWLRDTIPELREGRIAEIRRKKDIGAKKTVRDTRLASDTIDELEDFRLISEDEAKRLRVRLRKPYRQYFR